MLDWNKVAIVGGSAVTAAGIAWLLLSNQDENPSQSLTISGKGKLDKKKAKRSEEPEEAGPTIDVYFGSQTGTAEEFAKAMVVEGKRYNYQMRAIGLERFDPNNMAGSNAIFLVATYGEGDPTDNAKECYQWMKNEAAEGAFQGMHYAVFGLGNKQYDQYNVMGKYFDRYVHVQRE
jgi:NADPH-ferrihemoprotein reductase